MRCVGYIQEGQLPLEIAIN